MRNPNRSSRYSITIFGKLAGRTAMCNPPLDPPTPKEIGNCIPCMVPLHADDEHETTNDYGCDLCGAVTCDECKVKCAQCDTQGCKLCMVYDLENQEYFCDTALMAVETTPERLKQSECRADWLIAGDDSLVDGVAGEIGIGD